MKVLFIARRFPPSIGGMQQFAYDLSEALPGQGVELVKITWGGSSRLTLIFAIPWLFLRGLWKVWTDRSIDIIHMQDAVLSPPGWLLSKMSGKPWGVVAHGLDLTFKLAFYQRVNLFFARRAKFMAAISQATANEAAARGINPDKVSVIPLGVSDALLLSVESSTVLKTIEIPPSSKVLLTVGRLAKRKGVAWFVDKVMPKLDDNVHYVVIGRGVEKENIEAAVKRQGLSSRVHLLGEVDAETKQNWLGAVDIFVMPNITVAGDMEGFGIVAHEAALAGLPVVASNIEGIAQAVQDGQNGRLLPEQDAAAYIKTLNELLSDTKKSQAFGRQAREYTIKNFGWPTIARRYRQIYEKVISEETAAS